MIGHETSWVARGIDGRSYISQSVPIPQYNLVPLVSWVWGLWTVSLTPKGNRKSVTNRQDSPRSITSSHLTTEGRQPTWQSGSIRSLPMPRKDNANAPASAQAQQDAISEGIENFELPWALVTRIAKSAVHRSAPVLTLRSEENNST
jgi:hypothetical protein